MDLTKEQLRIAYNTTGHILVDAVAGSGKTTTLVYCCKRAFKTGTPSSEILLITSTESAKVKLEQFGTLRDIGVTPETFDSIATKLVKKFEDLGILEIAQPMNEQDTIPYLNEAIIAAQNSPLMSHSSSDLNTDVTYVDSLMREFALLKRNLALLKVEKLDLEYSESLEMLSIDETTLIVFETYENIRKRVGFRSSGDMLYDLISKLEETPEAVESFSNEYTLILIDEFHDVNEAQLRLLKAIAGSRARLVAVGDADQCVNTRLGADPLFMQERFDQEYDGIKRLKLQETFRFGPELAFIINSLFSRKVEADGKLCISNQKRITDVNIYQYENSCAKDVVTELLNWELGGNPLSDAGILVREFAQTIAIESVLIHNGIPYQILGGKPFFERPEIYTLRGLLHLALDNLGVISDLKKRKKIVIGLLSLPSLGISHGKLVEGADWVTESPKDLSRAAEHVIKLASDTDGQNNPNWKRSALERIKRTRDFLRENHATLKAGDLLEKAVWSLELYSEIRRLYVNSETVNSTLMMVSEFIAYAKETDLMAFDFLALIDKFELHIAEKRNFKSTEFVNVTTMHYAKGHEWSHVLIPNLERAIVPQRDRDISEERRLLYVALSRARDRVSLFSPRDSLYQEWLDKKIISSSVSQKVSPFLFNIDVQEAKRFSKEALKSLGGTEIQGSIALKVPFREKEDAKELGARYNGRQKIWYIPSGIDPSFFKRWL